MTAAAGLAEPILVDDPLVTAFIGLSRSSHWRHVGTVDLAFDVGHPQGMVKLGDRYYLSSVEVHEPTRRLAPSAGGRWDRTVGRGAGHLFVVDGAGHLVADVPLGEGDAYHPGGIDHDGRWLWVPVAEYRPGSASIVYRVDPVSLAVEEAFRVGDHVGGVVRNRVDGTLHGASWGSRTLYRWGEDGGELGRRANPCHFVDLQDGHYVSAQKMVCSGVAELRGPQGAPFELGGLALVDLGTGEVLHQVPVPAYSPRTGHVVTRNPVAVEQVPGGLRVYAGPDDGRDGAILVYDVTP